MSSIVRITQGSILLIVICALRLSGQTMGVVRGIVRTDDGRVAGNVEITAQSPSASHAARSDNNGRYSLSTEIGRNAVSARLPGYQVEEAVFEVMRETPIAFDPLLRHIATLDTVVTRAQPIECRDPTALEGFNCRRMNAAGIFLDQLEIQRKKPIFMGDVFYGLPGLETYATRTGRSVKAKELGRCIQYLREGRPIVGRPPEPNDLLGVEVYENYADVPVQYRTFSWNPPGYPYPPPFPCIIINFWTRAAAKHG